MTTLKEMIEALQAPVDQTYIKSHKVGGGKDASYISWYDYCNLLDERVGLGNWSWECQVNQIGNNAIVEGKLTVYGDDRTLTMMATGTESTEVDGYGDPTSNAEAMALRRAAAKFGLARNLWDGFSQLNDDQLKHKMLNAKSKSELDLIKRSVGELRIKKIYSTMNDSMKKRIHQLCS